VQRKPAGARPDGLGYASIAQERHRPQALACNQPSSSSSAAGASWWCWYGSAAPQAALLLMYSELGCCRQQFSADLLTPAALRTRRTILLYSRRGRSFRRLTYWFAKHGRSAPVVSKIFNVTPARYFHICCRRLLSSQPVALRLRREHAHSERDLVLRGRIALVGSKIFI